MSKIVNNAKVKNPLIVGIREQLEHRALWMYLLCDEAEKHGLKAEDFAPDAIRRCGLYQGENLVKKGGKGKSLKGLKKALAAKRTVVDEENRFKPLMGSSGGAT